MKSIKKPISPGPLPVEVLTAKAFMEGLHSLPLNDIGSTVKYYQAIEKGTKFLGNRMADIFEVAKLFKDMPLKEIEKLLESAYYEARMGAVSIMDFAARDKKISEHKKQALFDLYIRRHDRINNWDLVDRSAPYVVGGYLFDKSRAPLYRLAKSKNAWERRTAIVSTYFFIRQNDTADTFRVGEILMHDENDLVNKAVGSWLREAGKRDPRALIILLDKYAATMPRITLRYAVEKLDKYEKEKYLQKK